MKTRLTFFVFLLLSLTGLNAQTEFLGRSEGPLKPQSPLFGKDIVINDQVDQDQHKVAFCYAFNGWIYAAVTYKGGPWGNDPAVTVMKSIDNGLTWTIVLDGNYPDGSSEFQSVDILVIGDSTNDLHIILGMVATTTYTLNGYGFVNMYNEETGILESHLCTESFCYNIALASDFMYPAINSNPHSIGVLYSTHWYNYGDSIIFWSSSNGGMTLDNRQNIAGTSNRYHKVALAYGRSPSWSTGRYFAAWEEQDDFGSIPGRIYTSHSNPNFDSPFTTPVNLDGLDPADYNRCMDPAIACQYNNADNDSSNFSEMVLFDRYSQSNQSYDVIGYFNLQAANHSKFQKISLSNPLHNNLQPDVNFNPYDSTFMVTYFDSTTQKLPFLTHNYNLRLPNQWDIISSGYNDSSNLSLPSPKVEITAGLQKGANVWVAERSGGKGVAMFDAPYSTYTGVSEINTGALAKLIGVYPNPCSNKIKIAFELKKSGKVTINVLNILGQSLGTVTDQSYSEGNQVLQYDVSDFPAGTYFYNFRSGDFTASGKFTVLR